jgi:hypothetical protein
MLAIAGLSGGQRKSLIFELICQRIAGQSDLLLVFDEPFAGVTEDFIPFIVQRLNELRQHHNILLVTNDHIETLKKMADNTIVISATDRSVVQINGSNKVSREKVILALSMGNDFVYNTSWGDLRFLLNVEVVNNRDLLGVAAFTVIAFSFFLATFWGSSPDAAATLMVAALMIAYLCVNPYLLSLPDWRVHMREEAEVLLHCSRNVNNVLKSVLTLLLTVAVSLIQWGITIAVIDGFDHVKFWIAMLVDRASFVVPFIYLGLYTNLSQQAVAILGTLPFLLMLFWSTAFSPGSGVEGLKELRYLFPRYVSAAHTYMHLPFTSLMTPLGSCLCSFYFWCMLPSVQDEMEGCPESTVNVLYMVLTGLLSLVVFLVYEAAAAVMRSRHTTKSTAKTNKMKDAEFQDLQIELYGADYMSRYGSSTNIEHSTPTSVVVRSSSGNAPNKDNDNSDDEVCM